MLVPLFVIRPVGAAALSPPSSGPSGRATAQPIELTPSSRLPA
ncbi:hypothetical protein [Amycolatopsis orientalis]|nr:hypothetical protein [Amycolatopsis orientalis]